MSKNAEIGVFRGQLAMLSPGDLIIPESEYQRIHDDPQAQAHVRKIIRNFSWPSFDPLKVSRRADGSLRVVDGGHRKLVAEALCIRQVPCIIYDEFEGSLAEARVYLKNNKMRRRMDVTGIQKAELFLGMPVAVETDRFSKFFESVPVATVRSILNKGALTPVLHRLTSLLVSLLTTRAVGTGVAGALRKDFLEGMVYLESMFLDPSEGLTAKWRERVETTGYAGIMAAMKYHEAKTRKTPSKIASPVLKAEAMRFALNHRLNQGSYKARPSIIEMERFSSTEQKETVE